MAENNSPAANLVKQAKEALPEITVTDWPPSTIATPTAPKDGEQDARAEDEAEIIRQMDFYFSEDNLPHDAHLLGLFQEGNGTVSFNEVTSFKSMRKYKPKTWVREVLKRSSLVEACEKGKRLRRKLPLQTPPTVAPKVNRSVAKNVVPEDQPRLTKNLMKSTGFEEDADEQVTAEDVEQDTIDYPSDEVFTSRIETAVTRFCARRKMHELVRKIFDKFLVFGGFRGGQSQFVGGVDGKGMEELTKKEIAERTAHYGISDQVLDGLDDGSGPSTWAVDFEATAKGFLSSYFPSFFAWYDEPTVKTTTNVLRNFYRYLVLHKVCPEYTEQLEAAIKVCDLAEGELPKLCELDRNLPGGFNVACSMLFDGHHSDQLAQGDWAQGVEGKGWSEEEALMVFKTGIFAHGTKEQVAKLTSAEGTKLPFNVTFEKQLGLEIVAVEMPSENIQAVYDHRAFSNTIIKPMGKIRCKPWQVPHAAPTDLLPSITAAANRDQGEEEYEFLLEASTLAYCIPGFKFEAVIKRMDDGDGGVGLTWIDYHEATYASFFTWLANERIGEYRKPGPPKAWMERQNEGKMGGGGGGREGLELPGFEGERLGSEDGYGGGDTDDEELD